MLFLTTLCLVGYCFALTRFTRWSIEITPFFVIASLISLLYGFAYFGYLRFGIYGCLAFGAGLFLLAPLYIKRDQLYVRYLTPGFVFLFVFIALFGVMEHQSHLYLWDEFTQSGAHAKFIAAQQGLWKTANAVIHPTYPPGAALFYHLFYPFSGYSEGAAYFAQQMLILLPLGVLLKDTLWKQWPRAFLSLAFAVVILLLLRVQMASKITLYLDGIVGIYFGMSLLQYRRSDGQAADILYLAPILFSFMLLKFKLLGFTLPIITILLADQCRRIFINRNEGNNKLLPRFGALLTLLMTVLTARETWLHYLRAIHAKVEWTLQASIPDTIKNIFTLNFTPSQQLTLHHFFHATIKLLPMIFVVVVLVGVAYKLSQSKAARNILLMDHILLFLGFSGFLFSLLIMYLFAFGTYEGSQLASFSRYTEIYLVAWVLFAYGGLLPTLGQLSFSWKRRAITALTGLMILSFPAFLAASHHARMHKNEQLRSLWRMRHAIRRVAKSVARVIPEHAKVFTIWQGSTGLERSILTYELIPRKLNLDATSYGKPYFSGDVWTNDLSSKQFLQEVGDYDYLLLAYTDQNFWQHYGRLFINNAKSHPFAEYLICRAPEFNGFRKPGCTMQAESVYLFRIEKKNHKVVLREVNFTGRSSLPLGES